LENPNRQVKIAAYKALGAFIISLKNCKIDEKLLKYYCQMSEESIEITIVCA